MEEAHQCETDREDAVSVSSYGGGTSLYTVDGTKTYRCTQTRTQQTKYFISIPVGDRLLIKFSWRLSSKEASVVSANAQKQHTLPVTQVLFGRRNCDRARWEQRRKWRDGSRKCRTLTQEATVHLPFLTGRELWFRLTQTTIFPLSSPSCFGAES